MFRSRLDYVNRSALKDREQSMTTPNMTVSGRGPTKPSGARASDVRSPPMAHQNSGDHGYEMYPQQFVRLVGCHDPRASALRERQDAKLH
jgi:hypothetical protein